MDYGDSEEVVIPDADDQTADVDVKIGDHPSAVQTSSPAGIDYDEITNTRETTDEGIKGKKSAGPRDGTVSHDPQVLASGRVSKSASDHISVQVVQRII